jgi:hypothetical protein
MGWPPFIVAPDADGVTVHGLDGGPLRLRIDEQNAGGVATITYDRFRLTLRVDERPADPAAPAQLHLDDQAPVDTAAT